MGHKHGEDFKREAVRLARSSGLTRKQVAADLGIGLSTLGKWISAYEPEVLTQPPYPGRLFGESVRLSCC